MKKTGQFDVIKIISIFMILILHYLNKGMGGGMDDAISVNGILTHTLESICIIACNLFVLVTAWFMVDAKSIKIKKVVDIALVIIFYGIIIYGVCICTGLVDISKTSVKTFVNTIGNRWFPIIYIILYLSIPYINKSVHNYTKKDLRKLIAIMVIFFSIWPTVFTKVTVSDGGYGIINFVMLYLIIYYIKKYTNYNDVKVYKLFFIWIASTAITIVFSFISGRAWNYNSIFVILASVSLFMMFIRLEINRNKALSYISSFSLSTYIIHENQFITQWIYRGVFRSDYYSHTNLLLANILISIVSIFIVCMVIEIVRRFLFKYTIDKILNKLKFYNKKIEIEN